MKRTSRIGIIVLIILLSVGFAAITTTLFINGSFKIVSDADAFDVIFYSANSSAGSEAIISQDKRTITFYGKDLAKPGDSVTLDYYVLNNSSVYDANVSIEFNATTSSNEDRSDYFTISRTGFEPNEEYFIPAKNTKKGTITITLRKSNADDIFDITFSVTIHADAEERTGEAPTSAEVGGNAYDSNGNLITNGYMVFFSEPNWVVTGADGSFDVTLDMGKHTVLYSPNFDSSSYGKTYGELMDDPDVEITFYDTYKGGDVNFHKEQFWEEFMIGGEKYYYIGDDENGNMLLLAWGCINDSNNDMDTCLYDNYEFKHGDPYSYDPKIKNPFATYEESDIKPYVDEFVNHVKVENTNVIGGRLLTLADVRKLFDYEDEIATIYDVSSEFNNYNSIIDGKYWLGDSFIRDPDTNYLSVAYVFNEGILGYKPTYDEFGIRPVLIVKRT